MKLSKKIFLGICIPSIIAIISISTILIIKSFQNNIDSELKRCIQEFRIIEENMSVSMNRESSDEDSIEKDKRVIDTYADYYRSKGIGFIYYKNNNLIYKSEEYLAVNNPGMLDVINENVSTIIEKLNGEHYLLLSTRIKDDSVLVYTRNISSIYKIRDNLIIISIVLIMLILLVIALIAYRISKKLTKPLVEMQEQMEKVSKGNYNVSLKEGKNEIGILAKNFNKMSKEIENRDNELVEMINSKQIFIDNLSHEINTPLTSIIGYAELLEKANCDEEQKIKFLRNIQNDAKRINDIHKKLLLLSYKKQVDFEMELRDGNKIFEEIKDTIRFKVDEHKINLVINNELSKIYCDETLIIMCVCNLISNAINASKDGSKVIVNSYEKDNNVYIDVIDEGQGISKENIEKITEPFYRVDKARSRANGGAGLGLSICKSIMELHNGKLKIKSQLGVGSCFSLEFPKI